MSKANGTVEKKDNYLQHVSLKNYKSIKNAEIDFRPGLNIIIGKNGSGKTNFINALDAILRFNYNELLDTESVFKIASNGDLIEIAAANLMHGPNDFFKKDHFNTSIAHKFSLKINNNEIAIGEPVEIYHQLEKQKVYLNEILIKYGLHYRRSAQFVNTPFSFNLLNGGTVSREMMAVTADDNRTEFVQNLFSRLFGYTMYKYAVNELKLESSEAQLRKAIISISVDCFKNINESLARYTPIQAIRLNPDFNIYKEDNDLRVVITNFYLEFSIDNSWVPFSVLSDGTRRLFYIVSEIHSKDYLTEVFATQLAAVLIEEPELGIHPHQLHLLMQFIKAQSRYKQIIMTTHSPQVLDMLEFDELDRIIICHHDAKTGTQLRHLSSKEVHKAKKYMEEEAFLSDYWLLSDLEPAD